MNIMICGFGNIGKRHFEALFKSEMELTIYVYDVNTSLYRSSNNNMNLKRTVFLSSIDNDTNHELVDNFDVVIIATSSFGREELIKELTSRFKIRNLILEKVVFQHVDSYLEFLRFFNEKNINCYVNCPRRVMKSYKNLRDELSNQNISKISITGSKWNLLSNTLHFLDTIHFLSNIEKVDIDITDKLSNAIFKSKREGYNEMYGSFIGQINGIKFNIACNDSEEDLLIEIETYDSNYLINETNQIITVNNGSKKLNNAFYIEYVSTTTLGIVEDLIQHNTCGLANFSVHSILGMNMIKIILSKQNAILKEDSIVCRIT
jgi:hypothetical protein